MRRAASMPVDRGMRTSMSDDVRRQLLRPVDRLDPVGGLAHDLDVGLLGEHQLQAAPEQRVVVDDHDADSSRPRSPRGLDQAELAVAPAVEDGRVTVLGVGEQEESWPRSSIWSAASSGPIGFIVELLRLHDAVDGVVVVVVLVHFDVPGGSGEDVAVAGCRSVATGGMDAA